MQPLLLLKQTLAAPVDPGAMLLDGELSSFTSLSQIVPWGIRGDGADWKLLLSAAFGQARRLTLVLSRGEGITPVQTSVMRTVDEDCRNQFREDRGGVRIREWLLMRDKYAAIGRIPPDVLETTIRILPDRFLLREHLDYGPYSTKGYFSGDPEPVRDFRDFLSQLMYLPGLRGNARRDYRIAATALDFDAPFQNYAASLLAEWSETKSDSLDALTTDMAALGLTSAVATRKVDDTRVEIRVARSIRRADEMVSIADVGIGTSQVLPVLVALHAAAPGQFVYVEQPELHLHPRAQAALAGVLVSAVNRGVRLIIETHSPALLQALQIQIAEGKLDPERARFHWFQRDEEGTTRVNTVTPGSDGAYGDWPEDFSEIDAKLDDDYLDATLFKGMKDAG